MNGINLYNISPNPKLAPVKFDVVSLILHETAPYR